MSKYKHISCPDLEEFNLGHVIKTTVDANQGNIESILRDESLTAEEQAAKVRQLIIDSSGITLEADYSVQIMRMDTQSMLDSLRNIDPERLITILKSMPNEVRDSLPDHLKDMIDDLLKGNSKPF